MPMTTEVEGPKYVGHDGFLMPYGFPIDGYVSGLQYKAQPRDLFISTYPKSGTTWVQSIVYVLLHDGEAFPATAYMPDVIPHLEEVGKEVAEKLNTCSIHYPRILKTHLPFCKTPYHSEAKYIYIARNPKDVAVSFFFHTKGFVKHYDYADGKLDDFVDLFLAGKVDFGDYFESVYSWLAQKHLKNILFLTYEDMKDDPSAAVEKLANFLEVPCNEELVQKVIDHSTFSAMKKNLSRWSSDREDKFTSFIRKGEHGDWKNHLSIPHSIALERRLQEMLGKLRNALPNEWDNLENIWAPWKPDIIVETRSQDGRYIEAKECYT